VRRSARVTIQCETIGKLALSFALSLDPTKCASPLDERARFGETTNTELFNGGYALPRRDMANDFAQKANDGGL